MGGHKELLGLWMSENEGAKFWLSVLTELKARGGQDILIACVNGLKGFPDAIAVEFPQTRDSFASCIWCVIACAMSLGKTTKPSPPT
jgi:transposase-like protein